MVREKQKFPAKQFLNWLKEIAVHKWIQKNQLTKGGDPLTHLDQPSEQCKEQLSLTLPNQEWKFLGTKEIKMEFLYDLDQEDRGFF